MAQRVVDLLEPIQIQIKKREFLSVPPGPIHRFLQSFGEKEAIRQPRETVVLGPVGQFPI